MRERNLVYFVWSEVFALVTLYFSNASLFPVVVQSRQRLCEKPSLRSNLSERIPWDGKVEGNPVKNSSTKQTGSDPKEFDDSPYETDATKEVPIELTACYLAIFIQTSLLDFEQ